MHEQVPHQEINLQSQIDQHPTLPDSNSTLETRYLKEHLGINYMCNSQSDMMQGKDIENNSNASEDLSQRVAQKLRVPIAPKKIFNIQKVERQTQISDGHSSIRKNESNDNTVAATAGADDQPRKLLGSKRRLFETQNVTHVENNQYKRIKPDGLDTTIESSSFKCLEQLIKLILSSEAKQSHEQYQISLLTQLGHCLQSPEYTVLRQHSHMLVHVGFLAKEQQVSNELILRDLKQKYGF